MYNSPLCLHASFTYHFDLYGQLCLFRWVILFSQMNVKTEEQVVNRINVKVVSLVSYVTDLMVQSLPLDLQEAQWEVGLAKR